MSRRLLEDLKIALELGLDPSRWTPENKKQVDIEHLRRRLRGEKY